MWGLSPGATRMGAVASVCFLAALTFPLTQPIADNGPADHPGALWVVGGDSVVKISTLPGQLRFSLPDTGFAAIAATNPETGDVWVYGKGRLAAFRADGGPIRAVDVPAPESGDVRGLVVDGRAQRVWLAIGRTLRRFDHQGQLLGARRLTKPIADLALDRERSRLWVATKRRLQPFDPQAASVGEVELPPRAKIRALDFGNAEDRLWVAEGQDLERRGADGSLEQRFEQPLKSFVADLSANGAGGVWLASRQRLALMTAGGEIAVNLRPFQNEAKLASAKMAGGDDDGGGRTVRVNADPWDGSVWIANKKRLHNYGSDGDLLHELTVDTASQQRTQTVHEAALYADIDPPTITFEAPEPEVFTNDSTPALEVGYSDIGSGVDPETLAFRRAGASLATDCDADAEGATCEPVNELPEGFHTVEAQVDDFAFNRSTPAEVGFTVDTIPPEFLALQPADGTVTDRREITFQGRINEPVTLTVNGAELALDRDLGFSHIVRLNEGNNNFTFVATDRAGNRNVLSRTIALESAPTIAPIDDQTVLPGNVLTFTVDAGEDAELSVAPIPLPENASFDSATGVFRFEPALNQMGEFELMFTARDAGNPDTETVRIRVETPDPDGPIGVKGRVMDANAAVGDERIPVVGATVSLRGTSAETTTDIEGRFELTGVPAGEGLLVIDGGTADPAPEGSTYADFRREIKLLENVIRQIERPLFLPRINASSASTVDPDATTVVENERIGVALTVPPHSAKTPDGSEFSGDLSVSIVPREFAPVELPDRLHPGMLVTIQPAGVRFDIPAQITFLNFDDLAPGSIVDLWSLDATQGAFRRTGEGRVSEDGQRIDTIQDGITSASWHTALPPENSNEESDEADSDNDVPNCGDSRNAGSQVASKTGCVRTRIALPRYRSQGVDRGVTLVYDTGRAEPFPVIPFNSTIAREGAVPNTVSYELFVGGSLQAGETFLSTDAFEEGRDETFRAVAGFSARALATGIYPYRVQVTNNYDSTSVASSIRGDVPVVNGSQSPFGTGWHVKGVSRVHIDDAGRALIVDGSGGHTVFRPLAPRPRITVVEGVVRLARPLESVRVGDVGPAGHVLSIFVEEHDFVLPENVPVDATEPGVYDQREDLQLTEIPAGTPVASYFLNFPSGEELDRHGIQFNQDILGVVGAISERKDIANDILGLEETLYGLEGDPNGDNDFDLAGRHGAFSISSDRRVISVVAETSGEVDNLRVITKPTAFGDIDVFRGPKGDTSKLRRNADGTFTRKLKDGTEVHFNESGLQTAVIDRKGNATSYTYDAGGRLATITGPEGKITRFEYSSGHLNKIVDPVGRVTRFEHDGEGNLTRAQMPDGTARSFGYDARHRLTTETDRRGFTVQREYGVAGRLRRVLLPDGSERAFQDAQTVGFVDPASGIGTADNPAPATRPSEVVARSADGEGRTRTVETGALGAAERIIDAAGLITRIKRDDDGNPTRVALPNGAVVRRQYDAQGNITGITDAVVGGTMQASYGRFATLTSVTDSQGNRTSFSYDANGNLTKVTTPEGRTAKFAHRDNGQVSAQVDPLGTETRFSYNEDGNVTRIARGPVGSARVTELTRTSTGQVATISDAGARTTEFSYDAQGRVVEQVLPDGRKVAFDYDANGNLVGLQPPGQPAHRFEYTSMDREKRYDPPDIGLNEDTTGRAYNRAQQLKRIVRPDGKAITFNYDNGGRLTEAFIPRDTIDLDYDARTGNLVAIDTGDQSLGFEYNKDLLTARHWSGPVTASVSASFDRERRVTERTINGGAPVGFDYDADGLLIQAGALTIERGPDTGLVTSTRLNGVVGSRAHNGFAELIGRTVDAGGTAVFEVTRQRDDLGRIVKETRTVAGETHDFSYGYDAVGRLAEVRRDGLVRHTYSYDANGNRVEHVGPSGTEAGRYDDQDRLIDYGGATYDYTANGELKAKTTQAGTTTYDYDVLGNLRSVSLPNGETIEYVIDGRNRRVAKRVDGTLARGFVYKDGLNPVAQLDSEGELVARFVYGDKANVPAYMIKNGTAYRIVSNHIGSVRVVINVETGSIVQRLDYSPYGRVIRNTNPGLQPFGFAGGLYDAKTGLVRFGARDYDPRVGRWTSKDPIRFAGGQSNLYEYVLDDPINFADANGKQLLLPPNVVLPRESRAVTGSGGCNCFAKAFLGIPEGALLAAGLSTGRFATKPRSGVSGGGRSRDRTSPLSRLLSPSDRRNVRRNVARRRLGRALGRFIARRAVPGVGTALLLFDIRAFIKCRDDCDACPIA